MDGGADVAADVEEILRRHQGVVLARADREHGAAGRGKARAQRAARRIDMIAAAAMDVDDERGVGRFSRLRLPQRAVDAITVDRIDREEAQIATIGRAELLRQPGRARHLFVIDPGRTLAHISLLIIDTVNTSRRRHAEEALQQVAIRDQRVGPSFEGDLALAP